RCADRGRMSVRRVLCLDLVDAVRSPSQTLRGWRAPQLGQNATKSAFILASKPTPYTLESSGSVTRYRLRGTDGAPAKPVRGHRPKRWTGQAVPRPLLSRFVLLDAMGLAGAIETGAPSQVLSYVGSKVSY